MWLRAFIPALDNMINDDEYMMILAHELTELEKRMKPTDTRIAAMLTSVRSVMNTRGPDALLRANRMQFWTDVYTLFATEKDEEEFGAVNAATTLTVGIPDRGGVNGGCWYALDDDIKEPESVTSTSLLMPAQRQCCMSSAYGKHVMATLSASSHQPMPWDLPKQERDTYYDMVYQCWKPIVPPPTAIAEQAPSSPFRLPYPLKRTHAQRDLTEAFECASSKRKHNE